MHLLKKKVCIFHVGRSFFYISKTLFLETKVSKKIKQWCSDQILLCSDGVDIKAEH